MVLKFSIEVAEDETISIIQSATVDGKLGELSVNVSNIIGIPPIELTTTAALTSTTPESDGLFPVVTYSGIITGSLEFVILLPTAVLRWTVFHGYVFKLSGKKMSSKHT